MAQNDYPEKAVNVVLEKVHNPIFFDKLASDYGIKTKSAQDQQALLDIARVLRGAHDREQVKLASAGNSFLTNALGSLKAALGEQETTQSSFSDSRVKLAASKAVETDKDLKEAALAYAAYIAQQ